MNVQYDISRGETMEKKEIAKIIIMTLGYGMIFAFGLLVIGWPIKGVIISSIIASLIFSVLMWKFIPAIKK